MLAESVKVLMCALAPAQQLQPKLCDMQLHARSHGVHAGWRQAI